jgi:hypothetical protein
MKTLLIGDYLEYLKDVCPYPFKSEGFINLNYNNPPVNSKRIYNFLFEDIDFKNRECFNLSSTLLLKF